MLRTKKEVDRHVREIINKIQNEDDRKSRGYNFARFYFNIDEHESARKYLSEFLSLRPKSSDAHKLMGQIYEKLGQKEKSIQCYKTAYSISDVHKDLVPRICGLLVEVDADHGTKLHWVEEGERLFPHHNSVVNLRENLMMANSNQSKEDQEKFYLKEIKMNPLSLSLHVKLSKLYLEWSKENAEKYEDGLNYVISVEARRPFPHSLEWYQTVVEVFKAYENWKKGGDTQFEEIYLSVLDRFVSESLASSCGPSLSSLCTVKEASQRLNWFGCRLYASLKSLGSESTCAKHMLAQYYFHLALLISIRGKNESILHKNLYVGSLLLHSLFPVEKAKIVPGGSDDRESIKRHWVAHGCLRVSQSGHLLNRLARSFNSHREFIKKVQEICSHRNTPSHVHNIVFDASTNDAKLSSLLLDYGYMKKVLKFVDSKIQVQCDQEVILMSGGDLRELVWLYLQYTTNRAGTDGGAKTLGPFHGFDIFRNVPFASSMNTVAPETLCHLDLVTFVVAVVFCRQSNADSCLEDVCASMPSILADYLYTPEQGEWWVAASALCMNKGNKHLDRFRSILQTGLEAIRHLGHHAQPPIQLTYHLAKYFQKWISESSLDSISANEIYALEDRAEHYWSRVVNFCSKKAKGILTTGKSKSKLFDIRNGQLNEENLDSIQEEGELFIAERLDKKGKREDAIQILSRLKTPKASFKRAMLYKKQAHSLLGNRMWQSLSLSARKEYISLLTQSRDALYLTLDRLKMPGVDCGGESGDLLNFELSEELTSIEHCLSSVALDDFAAPHSDDEASVAHQDSARHRLIADLDLTNGNGSADSSSFLTPSSNMFSTPVTQNRGAPSFRQEARPSSERLDAQLRHLTDIQQNTIKNIEEHNSALRSQNETLLNTMMTELKERYVEQKSSAHSDLLLEQLKNLERAIKDLEPLKRLEQSVKDLHLDVRTLTTEVQSLKKIKSTQSKPEPLQLQSSAAADLHPQIDISSPALQGVYSNYMSLCGQQAVASPLATHPSMFNPCQPPFIPPATLQEHGYVYPPVDFTKEHQMSLLSQASAFQNAKSQARIKPQTAAVPHSFQISLPSSNAMSYSNVLSGSDYGIGENVFSTQGLLSSVPPPVYSAVSGSHQTPKTPARSVLAANTTPVTQALPATAAFVTPPIAGDTKASPAGGSGAVSSVGTERSPHRRSVSFNESDHYIDDGHDPCPDFKPIIPLPDKVELVTGEEDEEILFEERVKLYRFRDKEWKERGIGALKILHNQKESSVRILMRREQTHKICCNHYITSSMELSNSKMSENERVWIWAAQDYADEKLEWERFCCKFKTAEIAQNFQKRFLDARKIAEAAALNKSSGAAASPTVTRSTEPSQKPLSEMFKPAPGSWSCDVCLVANQKNASKCAACQTPRPGSNPVPTQDSTKDPSKDNDKKVTFKFGLSTGDSAAVTSTKSEVIVVSPLAPPGSSSKGFVPSFSTGATTLTFGPNSSVSISPLKPGSTPAPSLFKQSTSESSTAVVPPHAGVVAPQAEQPPKFSLDGFTFTKQPVAKPEDTSKTASSAASAQEVPKAPSIFSNFAFKTTAGVSAAGAPSEPPKSGFSFNFGSTASAVTTTAAVALSTASSIVSTVPGGIFSGSANMGNLSSFGSVSSQSSKDGPSVFKIKDEKAFTSQPMFGGSKSDSGAAAANTSKDDTVEEFEPEVDFKPVIPMPDLVEVKTGEESEEALFCSRAKLFRYDGPTKEWKERGVGDIKLLKNVTSNKVRILMRRGQTLKVCANHFLSATMTLSPMAGSDKSWLWAANDFADEEMKFEKFAVRFKTPEIANEFKTAFENAQKLKVVEDGSGSCSSGSAAKAEPSESTDVKKPLSEMFKAAPGSWECSVCLVMNKADVSACVSCTTPKDGSSSTASTGTIKAPSSTGSNSVFGFGAASGGTSTSFTFGAPRSGNESTPVSSSTDASSSAAATANQPFKFTWNAQTALGGKPATAVDIPSKTGVDGTSKTTAPFSGGFKFGSPDKYEFSFSGVKSPRSREASMCESENGLAEEEEDNLIFTPVIPLPDKVDVVTGEEAEQVLFSHRSKLFRMRDGEFKERGLGDIKILQHRETGKIRLLMRREQVLKICLNHYLTKELEFRPKDDKSFYWVATDHSEDTSSKETFAVRFKNPEIAQSFLKGLNDAKALLKSGSTPIKVPPIIVKSEHTASPRDTKKSPSASPDLEVVFQRKVSAQDVERARKLLLPDNFFAYESAPPCPGCMGCRDEQPSQSSATSNPPQTASSTSKNAFTTPVKSSLFGETAGSSTPAFTFGSPAVTASGSTAATLTFGGSPATSIQNTTSKPTIFGTPAETPKTGIFGGITPSGSVFGNASSGGIFGSSGKPAGGSIFGGNALNNTPVGGNIFSGNATTAPAGGSIFGGNAATPAGGSIFGNVAATGSLFDAANASSTSSPFGSSKSVFGGSPSAPSSGNQQQPSKGIFSSTPCADDAPVLSFGDISNETGASVFGKSPSSKANAAVWESKPVFGSAVKSPGSEAADDDYDPHYEPVVPMPELVQVTTGEESWDNVFCHRAKLYRYDAKTKEWKERGLGDFKIQHQAKLQKYRFLQRREQVHKLSCNHYITPEIKLEAMSTSETAWCWLAIDYSEKTDGEPVKLSVKFKTKEISTDFKAAFDKCIAEMLANPPPPASTVTARIASVPVGGAAEDDLEGEEDVEGDLDEEEEDEDDNYEDYDEEDEHGLLYYGYCRLSLETDGNVRNLGASLLHMVFDDEAYGARLTASNQDESEKFFSHLISVQTCLDSSQAPTLYWTSLDELHDPAKRVKITAKFDSKQDAKVFIDAFDEGKSYAFSSGIEETIYTDVPESELYYGQAPED